MRGLAKVLLGAFAVFLLLAMSQEWATFSTAWFGGQAEAPALAPEQRDAATRALEQFVRVANHYYASGGDPRFAERLPASEGVVAEIAADVDYLRKNRRLQDPQLARLEIVSAEALDGGRVELRTREWWYVRTISLVDRRDADAPYAFRWSGRYLLAPGPQGWRVEGWEAVEEPLEEPAAEPAPVPGAPS